MNGRATEERPPWGYAKLLAGRLGQVQSALDIDTGGGEVLAEAPTFPPRMVATEAWPANARRARELRGFRQRVVIGGRCNSRSPPLLCLSPYAFSPRALSAVVLAGALVATSASPARAALAQRAGQAKRSGPLVSSSRCAANRAAGTITYLTFGADVPGLPADCAAPELDRAVGSLPPSLAGDLWPGWHPASATASQATTSRAERSGRDQP